MGGGGLVILRHKSWHVWNQDNVERVLVDEAAQREEQEELRETQFARDAQARHDVVSHLDFTTLIVIVAKSFTGSSQKASQPSRDCARSSD